MGILTTRSVGLGPRLDPMVDKTKADPKPVRGFNYAGQPMKDGDYYEGRPEHMSPQEKMKHARTFIKAEKTPEELEAARERMAKAREAKRKKWFKRKDG